MICRFFNGISGTGKTPFKKNCYLYDICGILKIGSCIRKGFKYEKIYLLGCDFSIGKNGYRNAYNLMELKGFNYLKELYGYVIHSDNEGALRDLLRGQLALLDEYHFINSVARKNNICIYNATLGGALDEFPRVDFDSLFT